MSRAQKIFRAVKPFCMVLQVGTCHTFVKPYRMYNTKSEQWTCGHNDLSSRFIYCNKCTTLVPDVDSGESCAFVQAGACGNFLYFPLSFESKTSL